MIAAVIIVSSRRAGATLKWLRLATLLLFSLLVGHDAVFAAQFGLGDGFREAMTGGGHDSYWMAFSLIVVILTGAILAREVSRAVLMAHRLRGSRQGARGRPDRSAGDRGFRREFRSIWPVLFVSTCVAFTIQENVEHVAAGLAPHGLASLIGTEHPFAVPVLALVSALLAVLGALVRWRIRALELRIARVADQPRRRGLGAISPAREWSGALWLHAWFLVRLDAGRAPPAGV